MNKSELEEDLFLRKRIGERIAEIRKAKGMTIRELAKKSGIGYPHISDIENGKYAVGIVRLGKICKAMDVEIRIVDID